MEVVLDVVFVAVLGLVILVLVVEVIVDVVNVDVVVEVDAVVVAVVVTVIVTAVLVAIELIVKLFVILLLVVVILLFANVKALANGLFVIVVAVIVELVIAQAVVIAAAVVTLTEADIFSGIAVKCHKFVVSKNPRSKLKHSKTDAPTELRLVTIDDTIVHLFNFGSYFSIEFNDDEPSFPPTAYKNPDTSTTSCVDLYNKKKEKQFDFTFLSFFNLTCKE